jgi:hypothetical protein
MNIPSIIRYALATHRKKLASRHLSRSVFELDVSAINKSRRTSGLLADLSPPYVARVKLDGVSSAFREELKKSLTVLHLSPNTPLSRPARSAAVQALELGFRAAYFTRRAMERLCDAAADSIVYWGSAVVARDPNGWAGQVIPLHEVLPSVDGNTHVVFRSLTPQSLYERVRDFDPNTEEPEVDEDLGLVIGDNLHQIHRELTRLYGVKLAERNFAAEQFNAYVSMLNVGQHDLAARLVSPEMLAAATRKMPNVAVASVYHRMLDGRLLYAEIGCDMYTVKDTGAANGYVAIGDIRRIAAKPIHVRVYDQDDPEAPWIHAIRPDESTRGGATFQDDVGLAMPLMNLAMQRAVEISEYAVRRRMFSSGVLSGKKGSLSYDPSSNTTWTDGAFAPNAPSISFNAYAPTIQDIDYQVNSILSRYDPQVSDNLSGRPTQAEVEARGAVVASRIFQFASIRSASLSVWHRSALADLLRTDPETSEDESVLVFWDAVAGVLSPNFRRRKPLNQTNRLGGASTWAWFGSCVYRISE